MSHKHLIIGPSPLHLDSSALFASESCKTYEDHPDYPVFTHPLDSRDEWLKCIEFSRALYRKSIPLLVKSLNQFHNVDHPENYWTIFLGWSLRFICDAVSERYFLFGAIRKQHPSLKALVLPKSYYTYPALPMELVDQLRKSDRFNWQISSEIWLATGGAFENATFMEKLNIFPNDHQATESRSNERVKTSSTYYLRELSDFIFKCLPPPHIGLYKTLLNRKAIIHLFVHSLGRVRPLLFAKHVPYMSGYSIKDRQKLLEIYSKQISNEDHPFLKTIINYLPSSSLEDYHQFVKLSKRLAKAKFSSRAVISGLGTLVDPVFAAWMADSVLSGTKLIGVQHGGGYGEHLTSTSEYHEIDTSSIFLSWGWQDSASTKVSPSIATRTLYQNLNRNARLKKLSVLWIGTSDSRFCYQLAPRPIAHQFLGYFDDQLKFAQSLHRDIARATIFRPYPEELGWGSSSHIEEICKYVKIDTDRTWTGFSKSLQNSSLVIVDHIGSTTFLQSLSLGIPTIVSSFSDFSELRRSAIPYYKKLKDAGVYYETWNDLATALPSIIDDVDSWWNNKKTQQAIHSYLKTFANSPRSMRKYSKTIIALASNSY